MTSSALTTAEVRRQRTDLLHQVAGASSVTDVFTAAARRLRVLVPHDAAAWVMTDPATGLPSAPSLLDGFSAPMEVCSEHWQREFREPDLNPFRQLALADRPAAALRATVDDPLRSARFRSFIRPLGYADELRAVLRVGDTPWAMVTLWRRADRPDFSFADVDLVARLSTPLADAVRRVVRRDLTTRGVVDRDLPGLLLFDDQCRLISVNEHVAGWLEELPRQELVPTRFGVELPLWLLVTAVRARDSLAAGGDGLARTRVRTRRGRWIVGDASSTRDASGAPAATAVTIEPASQVLMAPIIVDAYGLTEREQEVTRQISRGAGTADIARSLFLSPHTVRDHVKSILNKVGVSSRGELVGTLYNDQFEPGHFAGIGGLDPSD